MKRVLLALTVVLVTGCTTIVHAPVSYRELAQKTVPSNVQLIGDFTNPWTGEQFKDRVYCSGVQISTTDVLTAGHCVNVPEVLFGDKIKIKLADGRVYLATIVKSSFSEGPSFEEARDAALLRIPVAELPHPAKRGSSKNLAQGDMLAIVGNSFGELVDSFTIGVINFVDRKLDVGVFIQTDALSAGGNSGGGVYNMNGELIGLLTRGGGGFSLVVPIERVEAELAEVEVTI